MRFLAISIGAILLLSWPHQASGGKMDSMAEYLGIEDLSQKGSSQTQKAIEQIPSQVQTKGAAGSVQKNIGLTKPFVQNPKPSHIDEKGVVEKNLLLTEPVTDKPKPSQLNEKELVEENLDLVESLLEKPGSQNVGLNTVNPVHKSLSQAGNGISSGVSGGFKAASVADIPAALEKVNFNPGPAATQVLFGK